jgi:RNA polymerase sigma-70 factor, ECF subfamily
MEDFGRAFARGRAAYPRLKLEPETFRRHLAPALVARRGEAGKELPIEDLYLACACAAGVKGAAAAFEAKYGEVMHRAVARVLPSPAEQEEVVQRARQLLLVGEEGRPPKIASYRGNGPLESWVAVVTIRLAVSQGRSDSAERRLRERAGVDAMGPDAETLLLKGELRREFEAAVRAALAGLERRARLVLKLYLVSGMSLAAIGTTFGVAQQTVSRWLAETRDNIVTDVQHRLADRLKIAREDLPSIARLVASQLDISISRLLGTQKT